jgi:hypothetical protein
VSSAGGSCACSAANSSPLLPLPPPSQAALLAASPTDGHSSRPAHVRVGVEHDITAAGSEHLRFLGSHSRCCATYHRLEQPACPCVCHE